MIRQLKLGLAALVLALGLGSAPAMAQDLGCGGPYGMSGALGLGWYNYSEGWGINQQRLPYFSLYPPVYYSYVVPRPYGYSPFAYPPGTMTPEVPQVPAAAMIQNPFVPQREGQPAAAERTTQAPRTYINPFVAKARESAEVSVAENTH